MRGTDRSLLVLLLLASAYAHAQDTDRQGYSDTVGRFGDRMKEFTVDAEAIADAREAEARAKISKGYDAQIAELSATQATVRKDAMAHFEAFLAKYPRSDYAPHVMFRLGDLYYDEAEELWYEKDQELQKVMEANPDASAEMALPQKDYTKSIALYERIIREYPKYEFVDGCYYMLGYTHTELNSMQLDEDAGKDWFLQLVDDYPRSEFAADANMRLGEYFFDHNDLDRAIAHYQRVVDGGREGRLYDRGLYKLAWSYYKKSDYDVGLKLLTDLLDYSRDQFLDTGEESPMEPEAVEYTAISFSDVADRAEARPVDVAQGFYQKVGEREYEPKIYKRLADVLTKQARYEDAIATYGYIQQRWPNDPENPTYQFKVAQLNMSLPIPDPDAANVAITQLNELYRDGTAWRVANRNDPTALATADKYIEDSLASVATNYHVHAQQTGSVEDYAKAAELYAQYLKKFPFSDNYYEITWYLADTLAKSGKLDEATKLYEVLAKAEGHPYVDGARYELMLARRQLLVQKYGKEDALPPDAQVERVVTLPSGKERRVYALGADHKAFIDIADSLADTTLGGEHAKALEDNRPAIAYICAQILYAHGRFDEARSRFEAIIQRWPARDEAAFAASLVLDSYQADEDLATLKLKAAHYSGMVLGQSKAAADKKQVFQSIEEGATFKLAMDHIKSGNRAAAADAFLEFMKAYPSSKYIKDAHYNAANSLEIIGRVDEANALFEQYVQKWPKDERSRALFFRIAGNYANVLELQKAIANYDALVRNFPDADNQDAPAALYNSAFLSIGLGDHKAAAIKFEEYARKFPTQADAEQVRFQAGQQWEQVNAKSALDFYQSYLGAYYGKSSASANPDHVMESFHRIAVLKEETGVKGPALDAAWNDVSEAYAKLAPTGRVGPTGRNYAAHAAFRNVEASYRDFQVIKFTSNDDKNAELLTKTKKDQLDALIRDSTSIIETYQDFEYSSAALYLQGAAYFAYADMLFDAPPPKKFTEEQVQFYQEQIDQLRLPVEDKGKNRLTANLDKAKEAKRWSVWVSKTLELLNERYPTEYAKEKVEVRAAGDSNIVPSANAIQTRAKPATGGTP